MPNEELIAALERATERLPAATGAATCILFLLVMPEALARQDTWQDVCVILSIAAGFACALWCCIAALRATERGEAGR